MYFRNLTMMRFPTTTDFSEVGERLPHALLKPVGPMEQVSRGFVSPFGRDETEQLHHQLGAWIWLCVGIEARVLPASAVDDEVARRIARVKDTAGRMPGARERKRLRDDVLHEMLPSAPVKSNRINLLLDTLRGAAIVDTASRKAAENVMSDVRALLGSFPAVPLNAEVAPRSVLTCWIAGETLPDGLALGEEAELRDPAEGGSVVKMQHQELRSDEVEKHLETGKQVTRLALSLDNHISFVLGDDLIVRKLKFLDGALEKLSDADEDDLRAELDARFVLQTGETGRLFDVLASSFRISEAN